MTGDGVEMVSLVWPGIAAGGRVNEESVRLPFLLGRISVEGAGVGREVEDMIESLRDIPASKRFRSG